MLKKKLLSAVCAAVLLLAGAVPAYAEALPAGLVSQACFVMDAETGAPLFGYNEHHAYNPASVTKIMTMGLACEKAQGNWDVSLTVSHDDVHSLWRTDSTHIALQEGEIVTLEQMLYAAMLESANDACNVLAGYIGGDGTIASGVAVMNAKAAELGLENTHFVNPHGISEDDHYISPYDLASILKWALDQPGFYELFTRSETYYMGPTNKQSETRGFWMDDYMRLPGKRYAYVPEILGGKTGYTDEARYTYACLAERDGVQVICVTMHSQLRTDKFADVKALLNFAFDNYRRVDVPVQIGAAQVAVAGGGGVIGTVAANAPGVSVLLHKDLDASAVTVAAAEESYVIGGALPQATWQVTGGNVQMDATFTAEMELTGLEKLFRDAQGKPLENAANPAADKKTPGIAVALLAAAGFGGALWMVLRRVQPGRKAVAPKRKMQYHI